MDHFTIVGKKRQFQTSVPLESISYEATYGGKYDLYVNAPKVLRVTLAVPPGYNSPTTVRVTNTHYADVVPKVFMVLAIFFFVLT